MTSPLDSSADEHAPLNGRMDYEVVRELPVEDPDETGRLFVIRFSDGAEVEVWEDEIDGSHNVFGS